ncbi:hypothetical protein BDN72DRAFT_846156 [Pluteus cervinus]|uniref:Uncharacterized protein n=1 Tax=Pluteus cervinus TaxID=181527 RepID=A0ACD3AI33_9AGAR|nr:hypothetical protein BDN72DRAFT_846156 [Pluteus cervinus]
MSVSDGDVANANTSAYTTPEIAELDKEIAELSERLLRLKSRRNSLVPIARLQPEILLIIFFSLQSLCFHPNIYHEWIAITHVSQRWRNLALGTSTLWGGIVHAQRSSRKLAELSLERSKLSDLDIIFRGICGIARRHRLFLKHITHNPSRIRSLRVELEQPDELDVDSDFESDSDEIKDCLAQSLPALKELTLYGEDSYRVDYSSSAGSIIAPNLRSLRLVHAQIKLPWSAYSKITHLEIRDGKHTITLSSLLRTLTHTTKLETLILWLDLLKRDTEHVNGPIYLSHLSSIYLNVNREDFVDIISSIKIPPTAKVVIPNAPWNLFEVLAESFLDGPKRKIHRFYYIENRVYQHFYDLTCEIFSVPSSLRVEVYKSASWLPSFLSSRWIAFTELRVAQLWGDPDSESWADHRPHHIALLSALGSSPLSELASANSFSLEVVDYIANNPSSFPALETLSLYEWKLTTQTLLRLHDALENRDQTGLSRLKTLVLGYRRVQDPATWVFKFILGRLENLGLNVIQETVFDLDEWFKKY